METTLSVIAIIVSIISMGYTWYTFRWTVRRDRKQATLEAYNRLQEQALDYLNYLSPSAMKEIAKDNRSEEYKKVGAYIARIEHFSVGVRQKIYDPETAYQLAHGYLEDGIKCRIEPIIAMKNRNGKEDYYENIHWLYNWMEKQEKRNSE